MVMNFPYQKEGNRVCHLYAVDWESGRVLWTFEVGKRVTTSPVVGNG